MILLTSLLDNFHQAYLSNDLEISSRDAGMEKEVSTAVLTSELLFLLVKKFIMALDSGSLYGHSVMKSMIV